MFHATGGAQGIPQYRKTRIHWSGGSNRDGDWSYMRRPKLHDRLREDFNSPMLSDNSGPIDFDKLQRSVRPKEFNTSINYEHTHVMSSGGSLGRNFSDVTGELLSCPYGEASDTTLYQREKELKLFAEAVHHVRGRHPYKKNEAMTMRLQALNKPDWYVSEKITGKLQGHPESKNDPAIDLLARFSGGVTLGNVPILHGVVGKNADRVAKLPQVNLMRRAMSMSAWDYQDSARVQQFSSENYQAKYMYNLGWDKVFPPGYYELEESAMPPKLEAIQKSFFNKAKSEVKDTEENQFGRMKNHKAMMMNHFLQTARDTQHRTLDELL